jgi:hypothetical protein
MRRIEIVAGTKLTCGVVGGSDGVTPWGDQKAWFTCALCKGRGSSVYEKMIRSDGKPGKTTSCGCRKRANYTAYREREVEEMTRSTRRSIFSDLHQGRRPLLTAQKFGIKKDTVDFVKRMEYARLKKRFSAAKMRLIYTEARVSSTSAMHRWRLTAAEVHAIGMIHLAAVKKELKSRETEWLKLTPEQQHAAREVAHEAYYCAMSVSDGRSLGEPLAEENLLSLKEIKAVKWIAETCSLVSAAISHYVLEDYGERALEVISVSKARKMAILKRAMNDRAAGKKLRRSRKADDSGGRVGYLSAPSISAETAAAAWTAFASRSV